jgi:hypothetical protein
MRRETPPEEIADRGEPACWAHLVCPQCGAMESEGHQQGCPAATVLPGG